MQAQAHRENFPKAFGDFPIKVAMGTQKTLESHCYCMLWGQHAKDNLCYVKFSSVENVTER